MIYMKLPGFDNTNYSEWIPLDSISCDVTAPANTVVSRTGKATIEKFIDKFSPTIMNLTENKKTFDFEIHFVTAPENTPMFIYRFKEATFNKTNLKLAFDPEVYYKKTEKIELIYQGLEFEYVVNQCSQKDKKYIYRSNLNSTTDFSLDL